MKVASHEDNSSGLLPKREVGSSFTSIRNGAERGVRCMAVENRYSFVVNAL